MRHACGVTLQAISQRSPDVLKRHTALALPLAFLAMHEKKKKGMGPYASFSVCVSVRLSLTGPKVTRKKIT